MERYRVKVRGLGGMFEDMAFALKIRNLEKVTHIFNLELLICLIAPA
jgi:hypothetical protein